MRWCVGQLVTTHPQAKLWRKSQSSLPTPRPLRNSHSCLQEANRTQQIQPRMSQTRLERLSGLTNNRRVASCGRNTLVAPTCNARYITVPTSSALLATWGFQLCSKQGRQHKLPNQKNLADLKWPRTLFVSGSSALFAVQIVWNTKSQTPNQITPGSTSFLSTKGVAGDRFINAFVKKYFEGSSHEEFHWTSPETDHSITKCFLNYKLYKLHM